MRLSSCRFRAGQTHSLATNHFVEARVRPPLVDIQDATFYRRHPSSTTDATGQDTNRALFPGLTFSLEADAHSNQHCAVVGPSNAGKTTFLEILQGRHLCYPPTARRYPFLSTDELLSKDRRLGWPARAIQYVGFNEKQKGLSGMGSFLSARFESRKEETDFKLIDFLNGRTQLNSSDEFREHIDPATLSKVIEDLRLEKLLDMPVINLSNGQTRRARIAKALMGKPELLLLDEPFMGLDPPTTIEFNPLLRRLAYACSPRILLALRPQDPIPDWITDIIYLGDNLQITHRGDRMAVTMGMDAEFDKETTNIRIDKGIIPGARLGDLPRHNTEFGRVLFDEGMSSNPWRMAKHSRETFLYQWEFYKAGDRSPQVVQKLVAPDEGEVVPQDHDAIWRQQASAPPVAGEALLEMDGVTIKYEGKPALGDWQEQLKMCDLPQEGRVLVREQDAASKPGLRLTVRKGQRWGIIGPNGSGKTTLLSLITSDHPQAYSAPMKLFGRSRLPKLGQPGLSLFEIQSRIGQSSPEVHSFFPRHLSVRRTLESAWADTPLGKPKLPHDADARVEACLRWFQEDLNPALGPHPRLEEEMLILGRIPADVLTPSSLHKQIQRHRREQHRREHWWQFSEKEREAVEWADDMRFSELTFSGQRVALFLRAIVAKPDIVILDEALSGMDEVVRDKCLLFLEHGENRMMSPYGSNNDISDRRLSERNRRLGQFKPHMITITEGLSDEQALIVVSHVPREIPRCVHDWVFLPTSGAGAPAIFGQASRLLLRSDQYTWSAMWRANSLPVLTRAEYDEKLARQTEVRGGPNGHDRPSTDETSPLATLERKVRVSQYAINRRRTDVQRIQARLDSAKRMISNRVRRLQQLQAYASSTDDVQAMRRQRAVERRVLLRSRAADRDPQLVVAEAERRLLLMRNWTSRIKAMLDEILKSRGEQGFERYKTGGYADRPASVDDAELAVLRHKRQFRHYRLMVRRIVEKLLGKEALPAFDKRHYMRPVKIQKSMARRSDHMSYKTRKDKT